MDNEPPELPESVQSNFAKSYREIPLSPKKSKKQRKKSHTRLRWAIFALSVIFVLPPAIVGLYALGIHQASALTNSPPDFSDLLPSNNASTATSTSGSPKASSEPGPAGRQTTPEPPTNCSETLIGDDVPHLYIHYDSDGGFAAIDLYVNNVGQFCGTYDVTPGFPAICKAESRTYAIRGVVTGNRVMISETHIEKSLFDGGGEGQRVALPGATSYTREADALRTADGSTFALTTPEAVEAAGDRATQSMDHC